MAPRSLSARITLLAVGLVLLTAAALVLYAHRGTVSALRTAERRSLDNILYLVERELFLREAQAEDARRQAVRSLRESLRIGALDAIRRRERGSDAASGDGRPTEPALLVFRRDAGRWTGPAPLSDGAVRALTALAVRASSESGDSGGVFGLLELPAPDPASGPRPETGTQAAFFLPFTDDEGPGVLAATAPLAPAQPDQGQEAARSALDDLLRHIHIQRTGYVAVIDGRGNPVAATDAVRLPAELTAAALDPGMARTGRRVMVLPGERGQVLYLLAWFRPYDWHIVLAAPLDELEAPALALVADQVLVTLLVAGLAILAGLVFARFVAAPVRRLALFARRLPEENMLELDPAAYTAALPPAGPGEVGELSGALRYMTAELSRNVKELVASAALRQRLEGELAVARDIQYGMLPTKFPHDAVYAPAATMLTAKEVGGDLYDVFLPADGRLCVVIGDVSDKGIPAALFMSMAVTLVRATVKDAGLPPHEAMARINDVLSRDNPRSMFVTLLIGLFDPSTGELAWASGGHLPPLVLRRTGGGPPQVLALPVSGDMVVGSFDGLPYKLLTARLEPGDTLLLYTDGVTEAMNPVLEQYGDERLRDFLAAHADRDAAGLVEALIADVAAHADGAAQSDDITLLALDYAGPKG